MNQAATPSTLIRGWRQSLRTGAWYRRRNGWTAIVVVADNGYRIVLKRTVWTFEDALADANGVLR